MPNYGSLSPTALAPGDSVLLFNAETPAAPQASIAVALTTAPGENSTKTLHIDFAAAPTAQVDIQCANQDVDADYVTIYSSVNKQHDAYTDTGVSAFYRARLVSQSAGGALTVSVQR